MTVLDRYVTRAANQSIFFVVLSLLALISLFGLFEELDESDATYGFSEALNYLMLTTPRRFEEILVYGLFLGYLIALGRFAETSELTVMRVTGMSPARLMQALAPSLVLWLALGMGVAEYIAPAAERAAEADKLSVQEDTATKEGLWFREGQLFMRVSAIGSDGALLGIYQYYLDENDAVTSTLQAERGRFDENAEHWVFENGRIAEFGSTAETEHIDSAPFTTYVWHNAITPDLLASQAFLEPAKMSLLALARQINFAGGEGLAVAEYELAFWSRVLKPLTFVGLALLALAVVMGPLREVGMGTRLTVGIFAGLSFKYLQDLFAPAAIVFELPPLIAVLLPICAYWGVALFFLKRNA